MPGWLDAGAARSETTCRTIHGRLRRMNGGLNATRTSSGTSARSHCARNVRICKQPLARSPAFHNISQHNHQSPRSEPNSCQPVTTQTTQHGARIAGPPLRLGVDEERCVAHTAHPAPCPASQSVSSSGSSSPGVPRAAAGQASRHRPAAHPRPPLPCPQALLACAPAGATMASREWTPCSTWTPFR